MRGLKLRMMDKVQDSIYVASFTDAWIETLNIDNFVKAATVASFTDAWIETAIPSSVKNGLKSHLLQMRGLKQTKT